MKARPPSTPPPEAVAALIVDDDDAMRAALTRFFTARGSRVEAVPSGERALAALHHGAFAVMMLDMNLPGMSGADLVPRALEVDPDLAIIMLTGVKDATSAAICMQRGALDYLTKPVELTDLGSAIDRALRRRSTAIQNREISTWLKEEVTQRAGELERERRKLEQLTVATLEALINALEAKNEFLAGHSTRVAAIGATIATELHLSDDEIDQVRIAGRLHDLGKIGVRESVLNKSGPLTDDEYRHVREHVTIGAQILAPLAHLGDVIAFVRGHHEHWDGSGYPDRLTGEGIPLGARILAAAEIFDALTTQRPYQETMDAGEAAARMRQITGSVIDPRVMAALEGAVARRRTVVFLGAANA
ncbi:MAG TPA: HD domain-containing phosphohydrolase [Gemmatimonadales bacterium]